MDDGQLILLVTTIGGAIATSITTIAGFYFVSRRENDRHRNQMELEKARREWDLADRERARAELALNVEQRANVLEKKMDSQHEATVNAVQRVTDIDDKIARLSQLFMRGGEQQPDKLDVVSQTLDRVEHNTVQLLRSDPSNGG